MKVIKVGSSSQSRIAQACDRCRSKKIRCDGIRPTCSQCANVGFECRTSDKLSRRAFPRGYTESLEERVRQLESEVRELKDLLDEKDEKIDMLSKMHGNSRRCGSMGSPANSPASEPPKESAPSPAKEDTFKVQASPLLLGVENSDSYFMGPSSGRSFIGKFLFSRALLDPTAVLVNSAHTPCQRRSSGDCKKAGKPAPTSTQKLSFTSKAALLWQNIPLSETRP